MAKTNFLVLLINTRQQARINKRRILKKITTATDPCPAHHHPSCYVESSRHTRGGAPSSKAHTNQSRLNHPFVWTTQRQALPFVTTARAQQSTSLEVKYPCCWSIFLRSNSRFFALLPSNLFSSLRDASQAPTWCYYYTVV